MCFSWQLYQDICVQVMWRKNTHCSFKYATNIVPIRIWQTSVSRKTKAQLFCAWMETQKLAPWHSFTSFHKGIQVHLQWFVMLMNILLKALRICEVCYCERHANIKPHNRASVKLFFPHNTSIINLFLCATTLCNMQNSHLLWMFNILLMLEEEEQDRREGKWERDDIWPH